MIELIKKIKDICCYLETEYTKRLNMLDSEIKVLSVMEPNNCYTLTEITKLVNLSPSRTSRIVDNLVKKGYLKHQIDSKDRRRILLCLSDVGIKKLEEINSLAKECSFSGDVYNLSEKQLEQIKLLMEEIVDIFISNKE